MSLFPVAMAPINLDESCKGLTDVIETISLRRFELAAAQDRTNSKRESGGFLFSLFDISVLTGDGEQMTFLSSGSPLKKTLFVQRRHYSMKKRRRRPTTMEVNMFHDFLAHRLSAAGVSYIVTSRSQWRRVMWLFALLFTFCGMSYMTYKVVQEYLSYPTVVDTKTLMTKDLEFPAITVCGLNVIPKFHKEEAGLKYLDEMKELLYSLPKYNISEREKERCRYDPMCHWLWFDDRCSCVSSPCYTEMCFSVTQDTCSCSMIFCTRNNSEMRGACTRQPSRDGGPDDCICSQSFNYSRYTGDDPRFPLPPRHGVTGPPPGGDDPEPEDSKNDKKLGPEFLEALKTIKDKNIQNLIRAIHTSKTDDIADVERIYHPSLSSMSNYGLPFDNIILSCAYGPFRCSKQNFTTLYSPTYGKCYMFNYVGNADSNVKKPLVTSHAGRSYGLQLYIHSKEEDVLDLLSRQLGARIVIHDPRQLPFASEHGMDIQPGEMVTMSVEYEDVARLGLPWGKCLDDGSTLPFHYTDKPYSQIGCERKCMNYHVYERCKCYHKLFISGTVKPPMTTNLCNESSSSTPNGCFFDILQDREAGKLDCTCPPPCNEKRYRTSISSGKVNTNFFKLVKTVKSFTMKNNTPSVANLTNKFQIMGLRVYYRVLMVTHVKEKPTYSWESLVANIGGNLGLFMGLSLVTFLEVAEFITDLVSSIFDRRSKKTVPKIIKVHRFKY